MRGYQLPVFWMATGKMQAGTSCLCTPNICGSILIGHLMLGILECSAHLRREKTIRTALRRGLMVLKSWSHPLCCRSFSRPIWGCQTGDYSAADASTGCMTLWCWILVECFLPKKNRDNDVHFDNSVESCFPPASLPKECLLKGVVRKYKSSDSNSCAVGASSSAATRTPATPPTTTITASTTRSRTTTTKNSVLDHVVVPCLRWYPVWPGLGTFPRIERPRSQSL